MMRALYTAATGMIAEQTNVDTISNNLSNVNTTGYKTQRAEFKSLLYQTLQTKTTSANGENKPITSQVGLGVRNAAISSVFKQGNMLASEKTSAFAIEGDGFFAVRGADGTVNYTRNGDFTWAIGTNGGMTLTNADGLPVLNSNGRPIALARSYVASKLTISESGEVCYPDEQNNPVSLGITIGTYQFSNPGGLNRVGDTLFAATDASGRAINENTNANVTKSRIIQGYLEGSNVQVANEMVNLIVAQRAYEMNSKAITTSDSMMETANNLKR